MTVGKEGKLEEGRGSSAACAAWRALHGRSCLTKTAISNAFDSEVLVLTGAVATCSPLRPLSGALQSR